MNSRDLVLWLDGADESTMFRSASCAGVLSRGRIGCWKDKSRSANHARQTDPGAQAGQAQLAGHQPPDFSGNAIMWLERPATLPSGSSPSTALVAATLTDPSPQTSGYRVALFWGSVHRGQGRKVFKDAESATAAASAGDIGFTPAGRWTSSVSVAVVEHSPKRITARMDRGWPSEVDLHPQDLDTAVERAAVGGQGPESLWRGQIPEIIVLTGFPAPEDLSKVQEYLARKWNVADPVSEAAVAGGESR
jgi:hypothetical protein